jgi:Polyketide cyclase / dehydrase and lipid transport
MKALKIIGLAVGSILVLLVGYILAIVPAKGHVEKSVVINASASAIFPYLNNFKKENEWSPWTKMDPEATQTFEGPEAGIDAKMSWDGKQTGKGSQVITESIENEKVRVALTFEGEEGTAWADFILTSEENGTKVTWTYDGDNVGFGGKAKWIIGRYITNTAYESGLQDLKKLIESAPATESSGQEVAPADSTETK